MSPVIISIGSEAFDKSPSLPPCDLHGALEFTFKRLKGIRLCLVEFTANFTQYFINDCLVSANNNYEQSQLERMKERSEGEEDSERKIC